MNMYLSNDFRLNVLLLPPSRNVRGMWVLLDISEKLTPIEVEVEVVVVVVVVVVVLVVVVVVVVLVVVVLVVVVLVLVLVAVAVAVVRIIFFFKNTFYQISKNPSAKLAPS